MPHKKSNDTTKCLPPRKSEDLLKNMPSTPSTRFNNRRMTEFQGTPDCFSAVAIDSPLLKSKNLGFSADVLNVGCQNDNEDSSITVGVRVRPFTQRELSEEDVKCVVSMKGNETLVTHEKGDVLRFTYDYSFWSFDQSSESYADQVMVYNSLAQPLLHKVFEGYNTCLFAYGQTSSGKSYSVMGHGSDVGIIPRFCQELFHKIQNNNDENVAYNVEISFFEIYNEKIHDLLGSSYGKDKSFKKPNLKVREHPVMGPFVDGLSTYIVKSFEDVEIWLNVGNKRRATASTGMNDNSSRSHSVFTLVLTQTKTSIIEETSHSHNITSKINLVDLAGSERQSMAKTSGDRLREGSSINKSLMALGKVISVLSEQQTSKNRRINFIPYRETILTWLLKESLGGNSKTCMLATISPSNMNIEETLSTLRYAKQARNIVNNARINEDPNAKIIRSLQMEIENLKAWAAGGGGGGGGLNDGNERCLREIRLLKEELTRKDLEMIEKDKSWLEKLKQSEACKLEEAKQLEKSGISLKLDRELPSLVNLNEDPQLSEVLVYVLRRGVTRIGRMTEGCELEVQLTGALIADEHCKFEFDGRLVTMTSLGNALSYVNGELVDNNFAPVIIHNGDRIVLAGDHFFRFINPLEQSKGDEHDTSPTSLQSSIQPKDFYFAYQEFTTKQNARLESELLKAKEKHDEDLKRLTTQKTQEANRIQQQLVHSKLQADNLQAEYQNKVTTLERMLKEYGHDHVAALDQIRKLEFEKQTLERKLNIIKTTQMSIDNLEVPTKNYNSDFLSVFAEMNRDVRETLVQKEQRLMNSLERSNNNSSKLLLKLHEANKISQLLKKDAKFSREFMGGANDDDRQVVVKVLRVSLDISTFWSVEKFEDKLQDMRDLFMNKIDPSRVDEIFFDSRDAWDSESKLTSSPLANQQHMRRSISLQSTKELPAINLNFTLGSLDLSIAESSPPSPTSTVDTKKSLTTNLYSHLIELGVNDFKSMTSEDTSADRVLYLCQRLYNVTNELSRSFVENTNFDSNFKMTNLSSLVHSFNSLQTLLSNWLLSLSDSQSEVIICSKEKISNSVVAIGVYLQFFIQGLENDVPSLVEEFKCKILNETLDLCHQTGKLSLTCQLDCHNSLKVISLRDDGDDGDGRKVSAPLKSSFINGCNEFVDETLYAAINTLDENKSRAVAVFQSNKQKLKPSTCELLKRTYRTVSSTTVLVKKLKLIQVQLMNSEADNQQQQHQQQQQQHQSQQKHPQQHQSQQKDQSQHPKQQHQQQQHQSQQQHQQQQQNVVSDSHLNAYNRCKFFCCQFSGIVDCVLQLIDMINWIISDENVSLNMNNLKSVLKTIEHHANNLTNNSYIDSSQIQHNSTSHSLNLTSLSDISMFRDRSCSYEGSLNESQIELLDTAITEVKLAVNDLNSFAPPSNHNGH